MVIRALLSVLVFTCVTGFAQAEEPYTEVEKLLDSSTTVLGQPFQYPNTGTASVTAVIVTMQPGEKTAKHLHEVPLFGYMLEGELTVSRRFTDRGNQCLACRREHGNNTRAHPRRLHGRRWCEKYRSRQIEGRLRPEQVRVQEQNRA